MYANGTAITLTTVVDLITRVVSTLMILAGLAIVGGLAYAGFLMITSAGEPKRFEQGKKMLWQVVIGGAVILGIGLIVNTIANFAVNPAAVLR